MLLLQKHTDLSTISHTVPINDISLGLPVLPVAEDGDPVKSIPLYLSAIMIIN